MPHGSPNDFENAILRLTSAYATEDDGTWITPPPRADGRTAITGARALGQSSTTTSLILNVHGTMVTLDPVNSRVTLQRGAKTRDFRVTGFTSWTISDVQPSAADPQVVKVSLGSGLTMEAWAMFPGVIRFVNPGNRILFQTNAPANAESNADLDPHELGTSGANDDWWLVSTIGWTITSGQLILDGNGTVAIFDESDTETRDWRAFLAKLLEGELRIQATGPRQLAQVFWLSWWKQTDLDNQEMRRQMDFNTMTGAVLKRWARQLGIEPLPTESDAALRVRVKGRILKRHGLMQAGKIVRAVRAMIGTTTPGGITLINNIDSTGVWQPRFVRIQISASLLEELYEPAQYLDIIQSIHDALEDALPVTRSLEVEFIGGASYDSGDTYDSGSGIYG